MDGHIDHSGAQKALSPVMARQPPLRSLPDGVFFFFIRLLNASGLGALMFQVFPSCYAH